MMILHCFFIEKTGAIVRKLQRLLITAGSHRRSSMLWRRDSHARARSPQYQQRVDLISPYSRLSYACFCGDMSLCMCIYCVQRCPCGGVALPDEVPPAAASSSTDAAAMSSSSHAIADDVAFDAELVCSECKLQVVSQHALLHVCPQGRMSPQPRSRCGPEPALPCSFNQHLY